MYLDTYNLSNYCSFSRSAVLLNLYYPCYLPGLGSGKYCGGVRHDDRTLVVTTKVHFGWLNPPRILSVIRSWSCRPSFGDVNRPMLIFCNEVYQNMCEASCTWPGCMEVTFGVMILHIDNRSDQRLIILRRSNSRHSHSAKLWIIISRSSMFAWAPIRRCGSYRLIKSVVIFSGLRVYPRNGMA